MSIHEHRHQRRTRDLPCHSLEHRNLSSAHSRMQTLKAFIEAFNNNNMGVGGTSSPPGQLSSKPAFRRLPDEIIEWFVPCVPDDWQSVAHHS